MGRRWICTALLLHISFAQSNRIEALFQDAVQAQQRGNFALAVRDYQQLLQMQPNLPDARANLGAALVQLGRFNEAIAEYAKALEAAPDNSAIRLNLGLAYYKKGDFGRAAKIFESLRRSDAQNPRLATLLADCYSRMGDDSKAVALLGPFAAENPNDLDLAYVLGSALIRTGRAEQGLMLIEKVAKQGNSADAYLLAGATLLKLNQKDQALADLDFAIRLNPKLSGAYTQLGIAKEGSGDLDGAEKDLRTALELNSDDFEANVHLGGILYTRRELDKAKIFVERALKIRPVSLFAVYEMALIKSATGDVDSAAKDLEKVVQGDPNWITPHVQLAALYYKLHRPADGLRERQIVDRLTAEQREENSPAQHP